MAAQNLERSARGIAQKVLLGLLCVARAVACLGVAASAALAQAPDRRWAETPTGHRVEEVLVTGEHPGPGMWRVEHGDHILWILGTHAPLPQRLVWRSQEVEFAISEAQQVIDAYSASFTLVDGDALSLEGKPLRRVLPRRAYSQWRSLKAKYIGRNAEIETALPVTAALVLRSSAFVQAGLGDANNVLRELHRLAKAYQVPVTNDHQVTRLVAGVPDDEAARRRGVDFLIETMKNLETDLKAARARANAWAVGDVDALRAQAAADTNVARLYANSWPYLTDTELKELAAETDAKWLAAAERALRRNRTTVATLPIFMLLDPDGLLSELRARGFEVIEPTR